LRRTRARRERARAPAGRRGVEKSGVERMPKNEKNTTCGSHKILLFGLIEGGGGGGGWGAIDPREP